ncbi:sigma 54-interacting transcriptional regulator [Spirulina sp. 06S082]|uniref:sigma 54-interacting transcriptional regulator n=1 Tax=Spirulina sp. 06S082 TaxID=3110248 RepID=UPI002B1F3A30|nr:sigma 54-interacting transcriptional regulator [Spirulina sp. 06S082]MEA5472391.1 sigma 54-interacting transcriptional regulator [Spirulina sp. 06S082]
MTIQPLKLINLNESAIEECINWLSFHRIWGQLSSKAIEAIAQCLQVFQVEADREIYEQASKPLGFYLLKWGSVEIYRSSLVGKTHINYRSAGEIFGCEPLLESETTAIYYASAAALSKSEIWFLGRDRFVTLTNTYPELQGVINYLLAQDLAYFTQRVAKEQERIQGLQAYTRPMTVDESVIGNSKASQKLAQQVQQTATDLKPVILQAPLGSGKTFLSGLIHSNSGLKNRPFAEIDLAQLPKSENSQLNTDALFGRAESQLGVIELLERGTLLIENAHLLSQSERDRLSDYLKTGRIIANRGKEERTKETVSWVRLIFASPQKISFPSVEIHQIKLFTLAQRKQDIPDFTRYFLAKFCRERGRSPLEINQADLRRLLSYDYPENIAELAAILKRAASMTPAEQTVIPEQVLWSVESAKNAFRVDLLNQIPGLRRFLLSNWWPERFWLLMMAIFIPVTIMGLIGPQTRDASMTLNFFWAWWWPFYLLLFPIIGRLWCAVCPFMIAGEWIRTISLWIWPRQLLPWPTKWLNKWGAWVLWAGFVAIYLWEKLWDLPHTAYLSSWLLIIIAAGAVIGSLIYERRLWCRYLCPIGGMNGMFAKLAAIELRSTQQVCGSQCSTFGCYKGGEATKVNFNNALPSEGQATLGCPLYSHPAQLADNRDCVLCMTCLKACPNRSVQLNFRFPAADILENHHGFPAEVALMLLLFGGVFMHYSHSLLSWIGWGDLSIDSKHLLISLPVVAILLSIPFVATYLIHKLTRLFDPQQPDYLKVIYAYLPMTLGLNLAYYIPAAITEAGTILPTIARSFGFSGESLPTLAWSNDVAAFLQGLTLLTVFVLGIFPLIKITQRPLWSNLPHIGLMSGFTMIFFRLMF